MVPQTRHDTEQTRFKNRHLTDLRKSLILSVGVYVPVLVLGLCHVGSELRLGNYETSLMNSTIGDVLCPVAS